MNADREGAQWLGTWRNQFGSSVEIIRAEDGRLEGWFTTALTDSALYGERVPLAGTFSGAAGAFTSAGAGTAVSYTGQIVDGRLETLWAFVNADASWWRSVVVNHDTFERVED